MWKLIDHTSITSEPGERIEWNYDIFFTINVMLYVNSNVFDEQSTSWNITQVFKIITTETT